MKTRDIKGKTRLGKIATVKPGDIVEIQPADNLPNFDKKIKVDEVGDDYFRYGITEYSDGKDYPFYAIKDIKKISYEEKKNSDPISVPMSKRKQIEYEDDIVAVYRDDEEIYKGMEDDEPMKREPWKYDDSTKTYSIPGYEEYKKVCIDM